MTRIDRSEHGAAAVEFALVLLPLLLLLMGIVEFSRVYYMQLRMQRAADEAARVIALHDPALGDIVPIVDDTVENALGGIIVDVSDLTYRDFGDYCTTSPATVVLKQEVTLALPLPEDVEWDTVSVAGAARMPCET